VKEGETVVQIGAGAGYYTAILAELVGTKGRVIAYEIEPDIARRAAANLASYPQVEVRARSGVEGLPNADAVYVNAAATHPLPAWLEALKAGGRLLFPLQAAHSTGAMLMITRPDSGDAWPARFLSAVVFIACEGAQDRSIGHELDEAFRRGGFGRVRSLRFGGAPSPSDWLRGDGWALSTEAAE
jgi:protein-L-isoaspartate(D-aspartate) O-methyltransferase